MNNYHYNKRLKQFARDLRKNMIKAESLMWHEVLSNKIFLGYTFLRQRPIDQYIVDFLCKELVLIIEIDDKSHDFNDARINDEILEK